MDYQSIVKQLQSGKYHPVYFLHGTEPYYIDQVVRMAEQLLPEDQQAFNLTVVYGKEIDAQTLLDNLRRYPVMAQYQVVILKEAQEMRGLADLKGYLENAVPTTLFFIAYKHKKFNFNSAFGKILKKHALVMESKKLYDHQVPNWIQDYLQTRNLHIGPRPAALLAEYLGTDLVKVANELDKLAINLPTGTEVDQAHIETNIGISKDYNIFELQKALGQRNVLQSQRIVQSFAANPKKHPMPVILASLYNYFSKVYMLHFLKNLPDKELQETLKLRSSFFLKEYRQTAREYPKAQVEVVIDLLREYDLKSKGVGYVSTGKAEGGLLKEMVWKILHV